MWNTFLCTEGKIPTSIIELQRVVELVCLMESTFVQSQAVCVYTCTCVHIHAGTKHEGMWGAWVA